MSDTPLVSTIAILEAAAAGHNHDNPHQRQPAAHLTASQAAALLEELARLRNENTSANEVIDRVLFWIDGETLPVEKEDIYQALTIIANYKDGK